MRKKLSAKHIIKAIKQQAFVLFDETTTVEQVKRRIEQGDANYYPK